MLPDIKIIGVGSALGSHQVTNHALSTRTWSDAETMDAATIEAKTGIQQRFVCNPNKENLYVLLATAFTQALHTSEVVIDKVDGLFAGSSPVAPYLLPNPSIITASLLGLDKRFIWYGGTGCTAGMVALEAAYNKLVIESLLGKQSIYAVLAGDQPSAMVRTDSVDNILFSDGAGCFLLTNKKDIPALYTIKSINSITDWEMAKAIRLVGGEPMRLQHDGRAIFRTAKKIAMPYILSCLETNKFPDETYFVPHQANLRILNKLAEKLNPKDVYNDGVKNIGNSSTASVFIALEDILRRNITDRQKMVIASFGEGFSIAAAMMERSAKNFSLPPIAVAEKLHQKFFNIYQSMWKIP
jgi:3-oxoacyl-[acyl-carrier-protein] synthase III